MITTQPTTTPAPALARRSCAWSDAVGRGFAVGPTEQTLAFIAPLGDRRYCR